MTDATQPNPEPSVASLLSAFRTTEVHGDPDGAKRRYRMVFTFPTIEALHAADDEWMALTGSLSARSSSGSASGALQSSAEAGGAMPSAMASTDSQRGSSAMGTTADAQSQLNAMRAELERKSDAIQKLWKERDEARAELAALKAAPAVDVERIMALADEMVTAKATAEHANQYGSLSKWKLWTEAYNAAREALRAALASPEGSPR